MPDFEVHEPGMFVPIELARTMAELLKVARCPNKGCIGGSIPQYGRIGPVEQQQCQWCAEREAALANLK